ncbi:hypothetical protein TrLO_g14353 [Triparma laevis f. longispina]|uniref:Aldehyde dehydrogenase domain-containing protein n=1 Tax=Triparma laevis f. longispina TaxID=1714387 RepID=A0A9W6ZQN2_9STRA|nr:hypothetical protein TrLO_g14353 [Triparma laevis f. longispina]
MSKSVRVDPNIEHNKNKGLETSRKRGREDEGKENGEATEGTATALPSPLPQFIGGVPRSSSGSAVFDVEDPSTGEIFPFSCPRGTKADAEAALCTAAIVQPKWAATPANVRGEALKAMASVIRANRDALADLLASEQNKIHALAVIEIDYAAEYFEYYAGMARLFQGSIVNSDSPNENIYVHKIPLGVSVGICPWNFPVFVMARKIAPALLSGCVVVVKTSEVTPLTCALLAQLWANSRNPAMPPQGTWSVLTGLGSTVGAALVASPLVHIISMTGSVATGKEIMKIAADNMTKVSLELGGKAPAIVCKDADLTLTVKAIVSSRVNYSGQVCNACERVYVHEDIAQEFTSLLVAAMKAVKIGNPNDVDVDCCGLVNAAQLEKVHSMVQGSVKLGAKILCGGHVIPGPGYKFSPTVLTNVLQSSEIVQSEIFGPVLPILTFSTLSEAFKKANDSKYGLTSSIYTTNTHIIERSKSELRFGETYVNRENFEAIQGFHAGMRESGIGGADGVRGLEEYFATHVVYHRYDKNAGD